METLGNYPDIIHVGSAIIFRQDMENALDVRHHQKMKPGLADKLWLRLMRTDSNNLKTIIVGLIDSWYDYIRLCGSCRGEEGVARNVYHT